MIWAPLKYCVMMRTQSHKNKGNGKSSSPQNLSYTVQPSSSMSIVQKVAPKILRCIIREVASMSTATLIVPSSVKGSANKIKANINAIKLCQT